MKTGVQSQPGKAIDLTRLRKKILKIGKKGNNNSDNSSLSPPEILELLEPLETEFAKVLQRLNSGPESLNVIHEAPLPAVEK